MMIISLVATFVILNLLLFGWIEVQRAARRVAEQHPEFGPFRLVGGGCGGHGHAADCEGCALAPTKQARTSFLKKRSKKLISAVAGLTRGAREAEQKFFGSFFQKRTSSFPR